LGAVNNQRSLIGRANLVDGVLHCINAPTAAGRVWLMRDAHMPSTPELISQIATAMGKKNPLIKVPVPVIRGIGRMSGQKSRVERLIGSLCMDVSDTEAVLGWRPPLTFKAGIEQMVKGDG
jgi:nucleoside-diphosphate-sugar epimerase